MTPERQNPVETRRQTENKLRVYPLGFVALHKKELLEGLQYFRGNELRGELERKAAEIIERIEPAIREAGDIGDLQILFDFVHQAYRFLQESEEKSQTLQDLVDRTLRTQEEIAVTFARTSRDPRDFDEIALDVTPENSVDFINKWLLRLKHRSPIEHAVIHAGVQGISSLAADKIEEGRLGSYTEYSARFQVVPEDYYFTPEEIRRDPNLCRIYTEAQNRIIETYRLLVERGFEYIHSREAEERKPVRATKSKLILEKEVKDAFKNLMTAARLSNVGVTLNAREAMRTITKMLSSDNQEIKTLSELLQKAGQEVAPTLISAVEPSEYLVATRKVQDEIGPRIDLEGPEWIEPERQDRAFLREWDRDAENRFLAIFFYPTIGPLYLDFLASVRGWDEAKKEEYIQAAFAQNGKDEALVRESEFACNYLYEFLCSYGSFRDLKRHRMLSIQPKDLSIDYGYVVPELAYEMEANYPGTIALFEKAVNQAEDAYEEVYARYPDLALYLVTRAHIRPTLMKFNLRQADYFFRLRSGPTVHDLVRRAVIGALQQAREVHPVLWRHIKLLHL